MYGTRVVQTACEKTFATDLYAYAMVLWEISRHRFPWSDDVYDRDQIKDWVKEGEREEFPDYTPSSYQSIAKRCWAQDPKSRPAAKTVLMELRTFFSKANSLSKNGDNYSRATINSEFIGEI